MQLEDRTAHENVEALHLDQVKEDGSDTSVVFVDCDGTRHARPA